MFTWGRNSSGCLGRYTPEIDSPDPGVVDGVKGWGCGPAISVSCGHEFTLILSSPWKGVDKTSYAHINDLNRKKKAVPKITHRITEQYATVPMLDEESSKSNVATPELQVKIHHRRCSMAKHCPGFELDANAARNQYICKNCKLPRRLHDIN